MYAPFGYEMSIFATTFTCVKFKRKGGFWYNLYQAWCTLKGGPVASPQLVNSRYTVFTLYKCPLITEQGRQFEEPKPPTPPYLLNDILTLLINRGRIECRSLRDKPFWSGTCRYNRKWSVDTLRNPWKG
ncbi:uncharacterized protein VTP21DRAFT_1805 [Calcarisporiella thermophila]|uniref:uncharacterized protein n=1 Tax=Calcarisporiella thermophila TaxID=911321 RepID=UPI0037435D98